MKQVKAFESFQIERRELCKEVGRLYRNAVSNSRDAEMLKTLTVLENLENNSMVKVQFGRLNDDSSVSFSRLRK